MGELMAEQELLHVKLEGEPRGLLWATYARQCGVTIDTQRGLSFDTAISAMQYAAAGGGLAP
jgi:LysR family glycine cleavage system transcriptional activator